MTTEMPHSSKDLSGLRAAIIVDSDVIAQWQAKALRDCLQRGLKVVAVYICVNSHRRRNYRKHLGYYGLRATAMRTPWADPVAWSDIVTDHAASLRFRSDWDGAWQRLPSHVRDDMAKRSLDAVVKFGLGLQRDPDDVPARFGVLSFHHGDPAHYRGRPAGFYETWHSADSVGAMVQRLSNELDAGEVLAFGTSPVIKHSYRQTLGALYGGSVYLLAKALRNCRDERTLDHPTNGRNYRLPSNIAAARFVLQLFARKSSRLAYGMIRWKAWQVGHVVPPSPAMLEGDVCLGTPRNFTLPAGTDFLADPIPDGNGLVWCEAMHRRSGKGRIAVLAKDGSVDFPRIPGLDGRHASYPFLVDKDDRTYLLPEMSSIGQQMIYEVEGTSVLAGRALTGLEQERLVDPTLLRHDDRWWLFAGRRGTARQHTWLWSSSDLFGPYQPHPENPVVMDTARARPAGPIMHIDARLLRPGQDGRGTYGDGVTLSEIVTLTPTRYAEIPRARLSVQGRNGPHTVSFDGDELLIDSYQERLDLLAWLRRIKNRVPTHLLTGNPRDM